MLFLYDAMHIVSSDKSTTFNGTVLGVIFTNILISPLICDTKTLRFYPLISFRLPVLEVFAYSEHIPQW